MKKEKTEQEIQFETKMKELEKREKAIRKENKVKYGPGRRGVLIIVTVVLCLLIAVLGVFFVQQLLKDDKYTGGNTVVTTVTTTTTAVTVPTNMFNTTPVEIYPDDEIIAEDPDDMLDGGFDYNEIETPVTSATTPISVNEITIAATTTTELVLENLGGDFNDEDPFFVVTSSTSKTTTSRTDSSSATTARTTSSTTARTTASTTARETASTTARETVSTTARTTASTTARTTASTTARTTASTTAKTTATGSVNPPSTPAETTIASNSGVLTLPFSTGVFSFDPSSTRGHNAADYIN